jgi:hypothetical protein
MPCKRQRGLALNKQPNNNEKNILPRSNPICKLPRAYRILLVNGKGKWIDEAFEKTMDAIESNNATLRKASRLWSIPLSSLCNHLNGKT